MIVNFSDLCGIRKKEKGKIVLALGTFDLFHYEHLRYLQSAKEQGDILVVAIKDNYCAKLKGKDRPIIDEFYRASIVDNIKCVDYVVLVNYDDNLKTSIKYDDIHQLDWLKIFENTFIDLKPDILYYEIKPELQSVRDRVCSKYNVIGIPRIRTELICTTSIIHMIKNGE